MIILAADWFCLDCRVGMKWIDRMFWKCPECGTEVWPEEPEAVEREKKQAAQVARAGKSRPAKILIIDTGLIKLDRWDRR